MRIGDHETEETIERLDDTEAPEEPQPQPEPEHQLEHTS